MTMKSKITRREHLILNQGNLGKKEKVATISGSAQVHFNDLFTNLPDLDTLKNILIQSLSKLK